MAICRDSMLPEQGQKLSLRPAQATPARRQLRLRTLGVVPEFDRARRRRRRIPTGGACRYASSRRCTPRRSWSGSRARRSTSPPTHHRVLRGRPARPHMSRRRWPVRPVCRVGSGTGGDDRQRAAENAGASAGSGAVDGNRFWLGDERWTYSGIRRGAVGRFTGTHAAASLPRARL